MRLSTVFELLLIFLFLAFAASRTIHGKKRTDVSTKQDAPSAPPNRYCQCSQLMCNCCRDFSLPAVALKGPGCATVAYVNEDSMRLTMTFGDKVLRNITLAGKRPNPVCMPLPGGVSKFCGRIYGITRDGDHFKACLALELRSLEDLEAALRVSCFRFGPEGVKLEPGKPVPVAPVDEEDEDEDDYGFTDDDDDDDDDDDFGLSDDDDEDEEEEDNDVDGGDADYTGFSALSDEFLDGFFGGSSSEKNKKTPKPTTAAPQTAKPTKKPVKKVASTTAKTVVTRPTTAATRETTKVAPTTTVKPQETSGTRNENDVMTSTVANSEPMESDVSTNTFVVESSTEMKLSNEPEEEKDSEEEEQDEEPSDANDTGSSITIGKAGEEVEEEDEEEQEEEDEKREWNDVEGEVGERRSEERSAGSSGRGENLSLAETESLFPGLTALIRPPSYTSHAFPPARSARTHRRMRLPPIPSDTHF